MAGIAESIDAPRLYTYENLPQGPSWEDVKKLLASVSVTSPVQIRSRCAILLARSMAFAWAKSECPVFVAHDERLLRIKFCNITERR